MIVFSFAWRKNGHSPCNIKIAKAAQRIALDERFLRDEWPIIVTQGATASALKEIWKTGIPMFGFPSIHIIEKRFGYEGSEEVTRQAAEIFKKQGITEVIPVAQPFLQLAKCVQLVRKAGFRTPSFWKLCRMIGWIGFDRQSAQPWTRGPIRLVFYTVRQMSLGYRPPPELSE